MSTRDDIAAAASTVDGVKVAPYYRQSAKVGDGWVVLQRLDRDDSGLGFMESWAVMVTLAQDVKTAEKWIETRAAALAAALETELHVMALIPATLTTTKGTVPGLVIEGIRAH